jgi:hypothetical protein
MKNLVLIIVFLCAVNHLEAQLQTARTLEMNTLKTQMNGIIALHDFSARVGTAKLLEDLNIVGTPYAKEESSIGIFYLKDSLIKIPTKLNYYANGFEFEADGKTFVTTSNTIDSVTVDGQTYVFREFNFREGNLSRVLKVIDRQGENVMYVYQGVEFKQEQKPGPLVDYKPAHFEWNDPVYLFEIGDRLLILNNFKGLIGAFPGKENDVKKFIKENNINKDSPAELKRLLGYISKL